MLWPPDDELLLRPLLPELRELPVEGPQ